LKEGADAIDTSAALDARDSDVLAVSVRVVLCEKNFVQVFSHVFLIAVETNPTEQVPEPRQLILVPSAVTLEEARVANAKVDNAC